MPDNNSESRLEERLDELLEERAKDRSKTWDWLFKIMSALVIPLVLWGVKLEVTNAVQDTKITELRTQLDKATAIGDKVTQNTIAVGLLGAKIDGTNASLKEIKDLLRDLGSN